MPIISKPQDLPPEGGYKPIYFKRVPTKSYFKGWQWIVGYLAVSTTAFTIYYHTYKQITKWDVEMRSSKFVTLPILYAERDREYLRQCRRNRDEEAKLMANVEGWVVGTWYGEPIFHTRPKDEWINVTPYEFYAHCDEKYLLERAFMKHKT